MSSLAVKAPDPSSTTDNRNAIGAAAGAGAGVGPYANYPGMGKIPGSQGGGGSGGGGDECAADVVEVIYSSNTNQWIICFADGSSMSAPGNLPALLASWIPSSLRGFTTVANGATRTCTP